MRRSAIVLPALLAVATAACGNRPWHLAADDGPGDDAVSIALRAARAREDDVEEALHPGIRAERRGDALSSGGFEAFEDVGRELFFLDSPWTATPAPAILPMHARDQSPTADATRCAGCHHVGGPGGAGTFADLALLDGTGDDVLTADRRLPPMLAGAALLERAAAASPELHPFGWRGDRPRELRAMVAWSVTTHLGATATEDEIDALTTYVATLAPPAVRPPLRASLALRVANGAERLRADGCTSCHAESLPISDPTLRLSHGRSLDLSALLSPDGLPPYRVDAWTDLRLHRVDRTPSGPPVVTPPLWGVASRGPFLHDGRASTLRDAIAAHDGEARASRDAWTKDDAKKDLELFLLTLSRAPRMEWMH